ncbi:MAG TPA: FliM/FliN family flagellar motor switch protein [Gaiellaceae bacterium]|jgi:flagellar motor switch protein FliM
MSEVLSNDQIAALIEAAKGGQVPSPSESPTRRPKRVRDVDFTRPTKFTADQVRRVERGHESFCRATSTQLSAELRTPVELEVINIAQQTWTAALGEVPQPSLYGIVDTDIGTKVVAALELPMAMRLVERLLGGPTAGAAVSRELTEIEQALLRRTFGTILHHLSRTWEELMGITLALGELESQPLNLLLAPTSEPTLAITIELRTDRTSSTLSLLVPHRSIEPVIDQLSSGGYGDDDAQVDAETAEAVRAALSGVEVEVRAEVASVEMTIGEVLALKPGDVVPLRTPAELGGTIYADAVPVHRVKPGRTGKRRAVEVIGRVELS